MIDWVFILVGLVGGLGGFLKVFGGLLCVVLLCVVKFIGGYVLGEVFGCYVVGFVINKVIGGLFGNLIDVMIG